MLIIHMLRNKSTQVSFSVLIQVSKQRFATQIIIANRIQLVQLQQLLYSDIRFGSSVRSMRNRIIFTDFFALFCIVLIWNNALSHSLPFEIASLTCGAHRFCRPCRQRGSRSSESWRHHVHCPCGGPENNTVKLEISRVVLQFCHFQFATFSLPCF